MKIVFFLVLIVIFGIVFRKIGPAVKRLWVLFQAIVLCMNYGQALHFVMGTWWNFIEIVWWAIAEESRAEGERGI